MTWDSSKNILRNDQGDPVPQVWCDETGDWIVRTDLMDVKLTGSIPEYMWLDAAEPDPGDDGFTLAMGVQINTTTHEMTVKYYNGTSWEEVA